MLQAELPLLLETARELVLLPHEARLPLLELPPRLLLLVGLPLGLDQFGLPPAQLVVAPRRREEGPHTLEQGPPGPRAQLGVDARVALDRADCASAVQHLDGLSAGDEAPRSGLHARDDPVEDGVAPLFELGEDPRLEEGLGEAEAVRRRVEAGMAQDGRACFGAVDEAASRGRRGERPKRKEQLEPPPEVGEREPVRVPQPRDADPLEDTVAPQLVEHERDVDRRGRLVRVGHDAPHKVRLGRVQLREEDRELLLVPLADRAEVALADARARTRRTRVGIGRRSRRVGELCKEALDVLVAAAREERRHRVVERVAVLVDPAVGAVLDLARVVRNREALREARGRVLLERLGGGLGRRELVQGVGELREVRMGASPFRVSSDLRSATVGGERTDASLLRVMLASSRHAKTPRGAVPSMRSIVGWSSRPKLTKSHWMSSRAYSSCSRTNMWWLKNCCSFCWSGGRAGVLGSAAGLDWLRGS